MIPMRTLVAGAWVALAAAVLPAGAAAVELLTPETPWRVHLVLAPALLRQDGKLVAAVRGGRNSQAEPPTPLPPAGWTAPDFDDGVWGRYQDDLFELIGGYGLSVGDQTFRCTWPTLLSVRTRFGIADPAKVADLKLDLTYIGGVVVYVNGREVGRGHMPGGPIDPLTAAEDYPVEAYTAADGKTPLPALKGLNQPQADLDRYAKRRRTLTVAIPRDVLVKGPNVLALALHRAPVPSGLRASWSHLGLCGARLASAGGAGAIPGSEAAKGLHVWNAWPVETVTEKRLEKIPNPGPMFGFARAVPVRGLTGCNPFDPVRPVRLAAPRNGTGSGVVVLSDAAGLKGISASLSDLGGPGGAVLPAAAVQVRYAVPHEGIAFSDALAEKPAEGAEVQPVWLIANVPKAQPPGWYTGTLSVAVGGREVRVPVQVLVSGLALPDPKQYQSLLGLMHSPDTVALQYGVEPWSDRHFALLEKSVALLGQVGNDVIHVPIILHTHMGHRAGLVRFVKTGTGVRPDFSALERYLDLWTRHCPPPQVLNLIVWEPRFATIVTYAWEGTRRSDYETNKEALPLVVTELDPKTGKMSEMPAPMIGQKDSEAFWKPVFEGVRQIVAKRGWNEHIIMAGQMFDWRPTPEQTALVKQWAPYARWSGYSHWSGDPGPRPDGVLIATGGMEVGYKEETYQPPLPAMFPANAEIQKLQFLRAGAHRFSISQDSSPHSYRDLAWFSGTLCRLGLDFWPVDVQDEKGRRRASGLLDPRGYRGPAEWRVYTRITWSLTAPGPDGAIPTVRFQLVREAVQETEAWIQILQAIAKMPPERQEPYHALWQEAMTGHAMAEVLSLATLSLDWPGRVARTFAAAGELGGAKAEASWDRPPP